MPMDQRLALGFIHNVIPSMQNIIALGMAA